MKIIAKQTIDNVEKLKSFDEIQEGDRLFYELGSYLQYDSIRGYYNSDMKGVFEEIPIPMKLKYYYIDGNIENEKQYIDHHNLHILKAIK